MPQFKYCILYVDDVEKTLVFYETAFGFARQLLTPDGSYGELNTGESCLSFAKHELAISNIPDGYQHSSADTKPFGFEIGFTCDSVEATLERALQAGAQLVSPSKTKPWGQTVAYVRDINGFLVELCTAVE